MKANIEEARKEIEGSDINADNRKAILRFDIRNANERLSVKTRKSYLRTWYNFAKYLGNKSFRAVTAEGMDRFFYDLQEGRLSPDSRKPSTGTVNVYVIAIKRLYHMLYPDSEEKPEAIKRLRPIKDDGGIKQLQKEDLLTPKEIERICHAATNPRDKALVKVLFESGFRIGELLSMVIGSVTFKNENEAVVRINSSKTKLRTVLIISALPELRAWIQQHPRNNDSDTPLWISNQNRCMCNRNAELLVKRLAKKADINKKIWPHLIRHSCITWRKKCGMVEEELNFFAGWSNKSEMSRRYSHFSIEDMLNRQRQQAGLPTTEPESYRILKKFETCVVCGKQHPVGSEICDCGISLDSKKRARMLKEVQKQNQLIENMNSVQPTLAKLLPSLEKIANNGGIDKLIEALDRAANN